MFIDFNKKKFFENFFSNYDVILEDINVYKLNNTNFPFLKNFVHILKKFFNGKQKNYYNFSLDLWKIKFKNELKAKKIFYIVNFLTFFK